MTMDKYLRERCMAPPAFKYKLLVLSFSMIAGAHSALADTVIIPAGSSVNLSSIYGSGTGKTTQLSDLVFNGAPGSPSTLVVDYNTASSSPSWTFDSAGSPANLMVIGSGKSAAIQVQDGINLTISGSNGGVVRSSSVTSQISFDVGNGSTLQFKNNIAATSTTPGVVYSNSDVVFSGERGTVVFDNNIAYGYAAGVQAVNANVVFEGNATFTNNQTPNISGTVIRTYTSGDIVFSGHDATVIIANNTAFNSGGGLFSDGAVRLYGNADIYGNRGVNDTAGAIVAQSGLVLESNGVNGIKVHDNYSNTQSAGAILIGNGTAYTGVSLLHAKNSDIQFYNNRTQTGNGVTPNLTNAVANAINIRQPNGILYIAADGGRQILFKDPISSFNSAGTPVYVTVGMNTTTGSGTTTGSVTFTGEDFTAGSYSTWSRIYANTTVYGGVLELKDNAQYGVNAGSTSFTLNGGATLLSTGVAANVNNVLLAQTMTFANGSTIKSRGNSTLNLMATNRLIGTAATDTLQIDTTGADQLTLNGVLTGNGKLQKIGAGTLFAGNANQFANAGGTNLTAGVLNASNLAQQFTSLDVQNGATLSMGNTGANLSITNRGMIAGALANVQLLSKSGSGVLEIANTVGANQLNMTGGTLKIEAGHTLNIATSATLGNGVAAQMDIASNPALHADTLSLAGNNTLDVTGYAPQTDSNTYTLVSTQHGVSGDFTYTVAGQALRDYVDLDHFLVGWVKKDDTGNNIIAELGLVWRNIEDGSAHGTFNLLGGNSFNLGTVLTDNLNTAAYGFGWDGKSLTKIGDGTLILSAVNTYTGSSTLNAGTLRTDAVNTLASSSDVIVNGGVLDLNGHNQQLNRLSGTGGEIQLNGAELTAMNVSTTDNTQFAGTISDGTIVGGRFIKAGAGSLTLSGRTDWLGDTYIDDGQLILDGNTGGAQLQSNIIGLSGSGLSLKNGASLIGWIDPTSVDIDAASRWNMTATSLIDNLNHAGTIDFMPPAAGNFKTLTVQGNYTGQNGLIILNTQLNGDSSPSDKLIVQGDTAGTARLQIANTDGTGQQTTGNGIEVVTVGGQSAASFSLASPVIAGAYEYQLLQGDASAQGGNWYLRSTSSPRPETGVYLRNMTAASTMFVHTLHDRLGEPQYTDSHKDESTVPSVWVRVLGNQTDSQAAGGQIDLHTDTALVHLGGDIARWSNNGSDRWLVGLMGAYGRSDTNADLTSADAKYTNNGIRRAAGGDVEGYSVGAYATWYGNKDKPNGPYLDTWAQYNWFSNSVKGNGLPEENYDSSGWTVSVEGGYAFVASDDGKRQWIIEPQAQLAYNSYSADDHQEVNGTWVRDGNQDGIITRLGARLYTQDHVNGKTIQPFIEANWWYSNAKNDLTFNGVELSDDTPDSRYELKAGIQGEIAKSWQLWGHVGGQWGDNGYRRQEAQVGIKHLF